MSFNLSLFFFLVLNILLSGSMWFKLDIVNFTNENSNKKDGLFISSSKWFEISWKQVVRNMPSFVQPYFILRTRTHQYYATLYCRLVGSCFLFIIIIIIIIILFLQSSNSIYILQGRPKLIKINNNGVKRLKKQLLGYYYIST